MSGRNSGCKELVSLPPWSGQQLCFYDQAWCCTHHNIVRDIYPHHFILDSVVDLFISFLFGFPLLYDRIVFFSEYINWMKFKSVPSPSHVVEGLVLPRNECSIKSLTMLVDWLIFLQHEFGKFVLQCPLIVVGWCKVVDVLPCEYPIDYACRILFYLLQHRSSFYSQQK